MKNGPYTMIVAPADYPGKRYRGRYCYEHIYTYWKHHGVLPVKNKTSVHHKNEIKTDNSLDNLELVCVRAHSKHHAKRAEVITYECHRCGKKISRSLSNYLWRKKRNKIGMFCSYVCSGGLLKKRQ